MARIGRDKPANIDAALYLLARSTPAPIGNMRIKESAEAVDPREAMGFERQDVIARDNRFLEYAYEQGAAIGGATGREARLQSFCWLKIKVVFYTPMLCLRMPRLPSTGS